MIRSITRMIREAAPSEARRHRLLLGASLMVQGAATLLLVPFIQALAMQDVLRALLLLAGIAGCVTASWLLDHLAQTAALRIGFELLDTVQSQTARRLERVPWGWLTAARSARIVPLLSSAGPDLVGAVGYLYAPLVSAFFLPLILGVGLGAMLGLTYGIGPALLLWVVALVAYVLMVAAWTVSGWAERSGQDDAERANHAVTSRLTEFAQIQRTLRANRRARSEQSAVRMAVRDDTRSTLRLIVWQLPEQVLFSLVSGAALVGLGAAALYLWTSGQIPAGAAVGVIVVAVRFIEPIASLTELTGGLGRVRSLMETLSEVRSAPQIPAGRPVAEPPEVVLDRVSLSRGDQTVVRELSLRLEPGSATALIGPSGSGKSTVLYAIAGLLEPDAGEVLIDQEPARPGRAAVVFQFPYLFDRTIMENIAVGRDEGPVEEAVLADARVEQIASMQARGWEEKVGENGGRLSGGQRQRLSIARALASPSRLLLVDEATSALDHENEEAVRAAISHEKRTRLIIAHRPQAIKDVDRVIVLDKGQVVADGAPEELQGHCRYFDEFLTEGV